MPEEERKVLLEDYKDDIKVLELKKSICETRLKEAKKIRTKEEQAQNTSLKNLVFATTPSGNVYFEKDLKNIPEEYYVDIAESLEKLKNGYNEANEEKGRKFSNNRKLEGIHEIKAFKIRIIYNFLSPNIVYILQVKMKKSDNDSADREEIINRSKATTSEFADLKEQILDLNKEGEIIERNKLVNNRITIYLSNNSRGKKYE